MAEPPSPNQSHGDEAEYLYDTIRPRSRDIRILTLFPGNWNEPLRCLIRTTSLNNNPSYETLSYAWGDLQDTTTILLQDHPAQVTRNLEAALRHLRKQSQPMTLWVDALCIDQQNLEEKTHQVSMMGDIYKACSRVYIWLGTSDPSHCRTSRETNVSEARRNVFQRTVGKSLRASSTSIRSGRSPIEFNPLVHVPLTNGFPEIADKANQESDNPFTLVHHFAENKHFYELPCFQRSLFGKRVVFSDNGHFQSLWLNFMDAAKSSWWTRFWCVQEAILPREAIVVYGHWRIPWEKFSAAAANRAQHQIGCCYKAAMKLPESFAFYQDTLVPDTEIPTDLTPRGTGYRPSDLDWMLRAYRHKNCSDPRDKVFGILGLIDRDNYPTLVPNYTLSVHDVFTRSMEEIISSCKDDLRFLTGSGFNLPHHGTPSWVRNLDGPIDDATAFQELVRLETYALFRASGTATAAIRIHDHKELHTKGWMIDKVSQVGKRIQHRELKHIGQVLENWCHIAGIKLPRKRADLRNPLPQAFWRTIIGDACLGSNHTWRRLTDKDVEAYEQWVSEMIYAWIRGAKSRIDGGFIRAMLAATYGRAMFATLKGNVGLCDPTAQPGDEVWVLRGGNVPFILQPFQKTTEVGSIPYKFLGDGYLSGFMDGEALRGRENHSQELILE